MTAVNFQHLRLNDYLPPLSLEEVFRLFGCWSNIHSYSFDKSLDQDTLTVTGITSSEWTTIDIDVPHLPSSFEVRYHKTAYRQAFGFELNGYLYLLGTDSSGYPFAQTGSTILEKIPKVTPQEADVVIVFRQQQFENDASSGTDPTAQNSIWYSVSLYMNGSLIYSFITFDSVTSSLSHISFCAYDTDEVTYTNIVVPDLPETAEFGTLDQGEVPYSGLQRTIDGRYLRYFIRFDGTFRVFRTKALSISQSLASNEFYVTHKTNNLVDLITHARMVGAYIWAESIDLPFSALYGHRFQEVNNPMLITEDECGIEAAKSIIRSKESVFQETIDLPFLPLLEPEDRLITPEGDWMLTDSSYTLEDNGASTAEVTLRSYWWGEP